eukprot:INCI17813.1.p1 GENE.INCI17813.1~~INCI17813.1.p1  ORF type:complete len:617 (+),score=86.53 INCI17813.1:199-2049(+)
MRRVKHAHDTPRDKYAKRNGSLVRSCARCATGHLALVVVCIGLCFLFLSAAFFVVVQRTSTTQRLHGDLSVGTVWTPKPKPFFKSHAATRNGLATHGFDQQLSDSLSLDRATPDLRPPRCKSLDYAPLAELPNTSVIFVFCDELLSTLLRSIHSVLNRSPPQLLHEIVLVNDGSRKLNVTSLEANIRDLPAKITLLHHSKQRGLVQARLTGAKAATGDTITVLDSHIEVQDGWLEPLMQRIYEDRHTVVVPHIRSIDAQSFAYRAGGIALCGVLLSMVEHSIALQHVHEIEQEHPTTDPQPTPVMAGGLFSFDREFFFELGGYDEEMGFWGAENIEISFRIWMCGGRLELIPCSNVFHLFRAGGRPYTVPWTDVVKNKQRVVDVWMETKSPGDAKYAAVARRFAGAGLSNEARGPIDKMEELRDRLQCKSFEWFLENVYPENYFDLFLEAQATGSLRHVRSSSCLVGFPPAYNQPTKLTAPATASTDGVVSKNGGCGRHGEFMMTADGQLRDVINNDVCLSYTGQGGVRSSICAWADRSLNWYWDFIHPSKKEAASAGEAYPTGQIKHRQTGRCLNVGGETFVLQECGQEESTDPKLRELWDNQLWAFGDISHGVR